MSSSSTNLAVSARNVSKRYRISVDDERPTTASELLLRRLRHPMRSDAKTQFVALDDVSFDLQSGETLGVIGRNGAGKSTLLKILSRVTEPTAGVIDLYGKVGSLLEVGTGFHPELTGRENIFLNGAILGMTKRAIRDQFDSIVEFAEIGPFLDTPVKRYSSGMYVRLAFAVAAHLDPDILIIDEVLAVGDVQFQKKCLGKMNEVASEQGRSVLFVSHNMAAVESICSRCILLESGRIVFDGDTRTAIRQYLAGAEKGVHEETGVYSFGVTSGTETSTTVGATSRPRPVLRRITVRGNDGLPTGAIAMGEGISLTIEVDGLSLLSQMVSVRIKSEDGLVIVGVHSQLRPMDVFEPDGRPEEVQVEFSTLPLLPGRYWIELAVSEGRKGNSMVDVIERAAPFDVLPTNMYGSGWQVQRGTRFGIVLADPQWEVRSRGNVIAASQASVPSTT